MKNKRKVVAFVPYRTVAGVPEFYLQKRDGHATVHPNMFSVFGGGMESDEDRMQTLKREVYEELVYTPKNPKYFTRCERSTAQFDVFVEEVASNFEKLVDVQEGEYGKFLTIAALNSVRVSAVAQLIVTDISEWLKGNTSTPN